MTPHPLGTRARILLTSVFGPYAQDDHFGSRKLNPMELYHNQVTRVQGAFSLRMFHRSWGITMIQHNIAAPCTVLDFPTHARFCKELQAHRYDVVGISSISMNMGKVQEMCRLVRRLAPQASIVLGGHIAAVPGLERLVDADHIVRGDGIAWMREFLGQDPEQPICHPPIVSGFGLRVLGLNTGSKPSRTAATVVPSVGCPLGCNFCSTSAFFGGKGKKKDFLESAQDVFNVMCQSEAALGTDSFFVMDENFLLDRNRALGLMHLMQEHRKAWSLYVFSSANAVRKYDPEELLQLGVSWLWLGLESPQSSYSKLKGCDTLSLARDLHARGIRVLGSTIIGLEHHTPENIGSEIEHAVAHATDFHQFMLYTPVPGTPLFEQVRGEGRMLDVDIADIHGQDRFNFSHPAISQAQSTAMLTQAFERDLERNGPSLFRICQTMFLGWMRHKQHPDERIRQRWSEEVAPLRSTYNAALWAMERRLRESNREVSERIRDLRQQVESEFGAVTRASRLVLGPVLEWSCAREERKLAAGMTYEPPCFVDRRNWGAA